MFKTIAAVLAVAATGANAVTEISSVQYQEMFSNWIKEHNKDYAVSEVFAKYNTWKANHQQIAEHNAANKGWTMAMNEYGDMTADEFKAKYMGYKAGRSSFLRSMNTEKFDSSADAESVDWRQKGAVTPVKNQGQCGSCWSFSTTGSTEGAYEIAGNPLTAFSEQQLVDCSTAEGNMGCNGGIMDQAFEYIIKQGSLCTESDYPYTATGPNECNVCSNPVKINMSTYKDVESGSEAALKSAVNNGPVSVAIQADQSSFQFYSGGVMSGQCGDQLDHGVLVVGYGTDEQSNQQYWTVKNSWGAQWGENGYIRLLYGINQCGLANEASYPKIN
jgi:C1A family cysteine protease